MIDSFARIGRLRGLWTALLIAATPPLADADVTLATVFSDHMVLQRDRALPVWGTASPGETVTVSLAKQTRTARASGDGRWKVTFGPLPAGGPHTMEVQASNTLSVVDVLIGEVWLASGQSNMQMTVGRCRDAEKEQAAADFPRLRMFSVARTARPEPQADCRGSWQVCSPETVGGFSATAYYFGRRLHAELDVPIGLLNASWGGTAIEAWTSLEVQAKDPRLAAVLAPRKNAKPNDRNRPGNLFNGMIAPLLPYAIRGAIWYQGERNSKSLASAMLYRHQLPLLIRDWRKRWGQGNFPFLWVQLPNFKARQADPNAVSAWALTRESMLLGLREPATGMAVTIDIGEARNIHPKNKQDVGDRLAQAGLGIVYRKDLVAMGPRMRSVTIEDDRVRIQFDDVGKGLVKRGEAPGVGGFALAGPDRKFHAARARIERGTVVAWSKEVPDPIAVRYAFSDNPDVNLYNSAGLPASPFRSDTWEIKPAGKAKPSE